jgi:flagellar protein FlaG
MFSIDATGGQIPVFGLPEPPRKAEGPSHVTKTPPALAEEPGQAVPPPQAGQNTDAARAGLDGLERRVERLNREFADRFGRSSRRIRFQVEPQTRKVICQLIDGETQKVIRQFPPDEAIARLKTLDALKGLIVDGAV